MLTLKYTISLVLVLITVALFGMVGCRIYKPNCDPQGFDEYEKFVKLFEECTKDANNCKEFDHTNIPLGSKIVLESIGKTTEVKLLCGARYGRVKDFDVGLCKSSPITGLNNGALDIIGIQKVLEQKYNGYSLDGKIELKKFEGDEVCLVMKALGTGFVEQVD